MTVTTTISENSYQSDGVTTNFQAQFKFKNDTDLVVELVDNTTGVRTVQVLTTDYTVSGAGNPGGGTVAFGTAPPTGTSVYIKRATAITQEQSYQENAGFPEQATEDALDAVAMVAQEMKRDGAKSVIFPPEESGYDRIMPGKAARSGFVVIFDDDGNISHTSQVTGADLDALAALAGFNLPGGASSHAALTADQSGGGLVYQRHPFWVPDIATRDAIASPYDGMTVFVDADGTPYRYNAGTPGWEVALTSKLALSGGQMTGALDLKAQTDLASAATTDLGSINGNIIRVTGTTTITSFGPAASGVWRLVRFAGALTLTHNGTSLILPGGANIATVAGDALLAWSLGSGNWYVPLYQRSNLLATESVEGLLKIATTAQALANTTGAFALTAKKRADMAAWVSLTDAATIALDLNTFVNGKVSSVAGNRTLGNPSNGADGLEYTVWLVGDSATPRTITFGTNFKGDLPTITDLTSTKQYLVIIKRLSSTQFTASAKVVNS